MPEYELTVGADGDLRDIALYTIKTWGEAQADRYEAALVEHFTAIGQGEVRARVVLEDWPELLYSRCQHHYVFFLRRETACPRILAILHEKMDLMERLKVRLEQGMG